MVKEKILGVLAMTVCLLCATPSASAEEALPLYEFECLINEDGTASVWGIDAHFEKLNEVSEITFPSTYEKGGVSYIVTGINENCTWLDFPKVKVITIPSTYTDLSGLNMCRGYVPGVVGGAQTYDVNVCLPELEKIEMTGNDHYFVKDDVLFSYLSEGGVGVEFYPAQKKDLEYTLPDNTREIFVAGNSYIRKINNTSHIEKCEILNCASLELPVSEKMKTLIVNGSAKLEEVLSESFPEMNYVDLKHCANLKTVRLDNCDYLYLYEDPLLVNLELEVNPGSQVKLDGLTSLEEFNITKNIRNLWVNNLSNLKKLTVSPDNGTFIMSGNSLLKKEYSSSLLGSDEKLEMVYYPEGLAAISSDYIVPDEVGLIRWMPNVQNIYVPGRSLQYFSANTREMGYNDDLFLNCNRLETLIFGECENCIFSYKDFTLGTCENLKKVVLPSGPRNTSISAERLLTDLLRSGYFYIQWVFPDYNLNFCNSLESLEIPRYDYFGFVTPKRLFGVDISKYRQDVTDSNATEVATGESEKYIPEIEIINGTEIDGVVMPNFKTLVISRQSKGFKEGSLDLRDYGIGIEIGQPVTELEGFRNSSVTKIKIASPVDVITEGAFENADMLTQVEMPWCIKEVENKAFSGCSSLKAIYMNAVKPPVAATDAFDGVSREDCVLVVPFGSTKAYKEADVWKEFLNIESTGLLEVEEVSDSQSEATILPGENGVMISTTVDSGVAYVYSLDGTVVAAVQGGHQEFISLAKGIYIVKAGKKSMKIMI